jgi:hypothetical protein
MNQDFFPNREADASIWLTNFKNQIPTQGLLVGQTAAQNTTDVNYCQRMIDGIADVATKTAALTAAVKAKDTAFATNLPLLRADIARMKTNSAYTPAIGGVLGIIGTKTEFDTQNYKCKFTAEPFGGFIRIKFLKAGVDGVNIYHRQKGQLTWNFLARDTKSPYDDHIVLQAPSNPEHWEYQLFGVIDDAQIGLASDIIEVVYGG